MNMKKIYFVVLASLFSCQVNCATLKQPLWMNPAHDNLVQQRDIEMGVNNNPLQPLELASIDTLQRQLKQYCNNDRHLNDLYEALNIKKSKIETYNRYLSEINSLNASGQTLIKDGALRKSIEFSNIEVERLSQLSSVIIQGKNIDPSWQIAKYGNIMGSLSFVKNLFVPRDMRSYLCAGIGAVTGLAVFKSMQKASPTISINVPEGATNITIKDDSQQKFAAAVAICALGAGGLVAGTQVYNSWMYGQNSRDELARDIKAINDSNLNVQNAFALTEASRERAQIQAAQAAHGQAIVAVNNGVNQLQQDVAQERQANADRHNHVNGRFDQQDKKIDGIAAQVGNIIYDQKKFEASVAKLFNDSDEKSNARHVETTIRFKDVHQSVQDVKTDVAGFRNESAAGYKNLVQMHQQGQNEIVNLLKYSQHQNRSQLPYAYNPGCRTLGGFSNMPAQNSNSSNVNLATSNVDLGSSMEEVE